LEVQFAGKVAPGRGAGGGDEGEVEGGRKLADHILLAVNKGAEG